MRATGRAATVGLGAIVAIAFGLSASVGLAQDDPAHVPIEVQSEPGPQEEPETDRVARERYESGLAHYRAGRFQQAADDFVAAHEMSGRPELLWNQYLAYRDGGDPWRAVEALRAYLEANPDLDERQQLEQRIASMERSIAERDELTEQREVERRRAEGEQRRAEEEQRRAETERHRREAAEAEAAGASAFPWIVLGTSAATLIAAGVTGFLSLQQEGDLEELCPMDVCPPESDFEEQKSNGATLATVTDVLFGVGGALAATSLILFLTLGGDGDSADASVACAPGGCVGGVRARF